VNVPSVKVRAVHLQIEQCEGLRLTTARYYTPSGVSIHEKGITPHVEVVMTPEEDNKLARQRSAAPTSPIPPNSKLDLASIGLPIASCKRRSTC